MKMVIFSLYSTHAINPMKHILTISISIISSMQSSINFKVHKSYMCDFIMN